MIASFAAVLGVLGAGACGGARPAGTAADEKAPLPAQDPAPSHGGARSDPERAAKLADLDTLCAALNRDYVDGTLSDYYGGVKLSTPWGEQVRAAGNEADRPGRHLASEIDRLSPRAEDPALPACRELLDYIDEVE